VHRLLSAPFVHRGGGTESAPPDVPREKAPVHLYFSDKTGEYLTAERRVIEVPDDAVRFGKVLLENLLHGPQADHLRAIPEGTRVRSLLLTREGVAYVDLTREVVTEHWGGVRGEVLTIYSVVNTLCLNVPQIKGARILVDGDEVDTLAGHVDLRFPFGPNMLIVR